MVVALTLKITVAPILIDSVFNKIKATTRQITQLSNLHRHEKTPYGIHSPVNQLNPRDLACFETKSRSSSQDGGHFKHQQSPRGAVVEVGSSTRVSHAFGTAVFMGEEGRAVRSFALDIPTEPPFQEFGWDIHAVCHAASDSYFLLQKERKAWLG